MYQSFTIKNFRCFSDITVDQLERFNLIAGKNNVGKSTFLEALWLYHGYQNPILGVRVDAFRGLDIVRKDDLMRNLFSDFNPDEEITLSSENDKHGKSSLQIRIQERTKSRVLLRNGKEKDENENDLSATRIIQQETTQALSSEVIFEFTDVSGKTVHGKAFFEGDNIQIEQPSGIKKSSGVFLAARAPHNYAVLAERLSNLAVEKKEDIIVNVLKIIEPRLLALRVQHRGGVPLIYGDIGAERLIPFPLMGDGMSRLLGVALAMTDAHDGILLIDEIENGLHHSVMSELWTSIADIAHRYNVQIFATTHSIECILAAYEAFKSRDPYDFSLHRLEQIKGEIRVVKYDKEILKAAIETNLEVR